MDSNSKNEESAGLDREDENIEKTQFTMNEEFSSQETVDSGIQSLSPTPFNVESSLEVDDECSRESEENHASSQIQNDHIENVTVGITRERSWQEQTKRRQLGLQCQSSKKMKSESHFLPVAPPNRLWYSVSGDTPALQSPCISGNGETEIDSGSKRFTINSNFQMPENATRDDYYDSVTHTRSIRIQGQEGNDLSPVKVPSGNDSTDSQKYPKIVTSVVSVPGFPHFKPAPGTYSAAEFDHHGGSLKMGKRGIKLFVPPNAIKQGEKQLVYLYIGSEKSHAVPLKGREVPLTPTVFCGPHGLKFDRQVLLTLPHSASDAKQNWKFTTHCTDTEINQAVKYEERNDIMQILRKDSVIIFTDHFTGFGISGTGKTPVDAAAGQARHLGKENIPDTPGQFISLQPYFQCKGEDAIIRIHAYRSHALEDIEREEEKMGGKPADCSRKFELVEGHGDIFITLKDSKKNVNLMPSSMEHPEKSISFRNLWYGQTQSVTFVVPCDAYTSNNQFRCSLLARQKFSVNFEISECLSSTEISIPPEGVNNVTTCLSFTVEREIALRLDVPSVGGGDWRSFAAVLGLTPVEITQVQATTERENSSPASKLLSLWQMQQEQIEEDEICALYNIMKQIGNNNAAGVIKRNFPMYRFEVPVIVPL